MKFYKGLILSLIAGFMMMAYNNCSGVGFGSGSASSDNGKLDVPNPVPNPPPTPVPVPPGVDPRVPQIVKNCNNAIADGSIKTLDQAIKFDDTKIETGRTQVCDFGIGDNLPIRDGFMQARYEQSRVLNLPTNAVICDVTMTTAAQKFSYDDILFLTFNGEIMGSDNKTSILGNLKPNTTAQLSNGKLVPLYKYDWLSLRGAAFANVADDYCAGAAEGGATCMWPVTEKTGDIVFKYNPELLIAIGLLAPANQQTFGFVMTGDNDLLSDCYHSELNFAVNVKYYVP
ncbi:MAG: hypothetical protein ACXVA9_02265 [Bdellovibrionales bacterium]